MDQPADTEGQRGLIIPQLMGIHGLNRKEENNIFLMEANVRLSNLDQCV